jgi:outer membrane protein assembly factor BamB
MRHTIAVLLAAGTLAACDSWFGDKPPPPLPGERIPVLLHERTLSPDPGLAEKRPLLPPPSVNPEWPQAGGYPNHAMHHTEVGEDLRRAWSADIGRGADDYRRLFAQPVVADGRVFAIDTGSEVSAFETETGRRLWSRDLTPDDEDDGHMSGGIAYDKGRLFVTTGFAQVVALEADTGAEAWRVTLDGPMRAAPTVAVGRVFAATVDNKLYALDAASGRTLWTHNGLAETASILGGGSPAVDAGVVVVPYSSGELYALRLENGRVLWSDQLTPIRRTDAVSTLAHIRGNPIIDRGVVIAVSHGGLMVAIDLRTGRRLWDKELGSLDSPWVAGNYIYALTNNGEVVCLTRTDGRILWVSALPRYEDEEKKKKPIVWTGPLLASDRLIVAGSTGRAVALSPYTGRLLGQVKMPDNVTVPPVVANRNLFFLAANADLVAYR